MFPDYKVDYPRTSIDDLNESQCVAMFRFQKCDMYRLLEALQIPECYICSQRTFVTGMEALMILLRRLTYPNRWCDLQAMFGRSESELSLIFHKVLNLGNRTCLIKQGRSGLILDDIHDRFGHLLETLDLVWLDPGIFSQVIHEKGAPLNQCWGFIDGTPRPMARPTRNQKIMYSGHKRTHCIKFQSVQAPNGLIAHLFGPIEGKRHDAFMLGVSGLADKLRRF
ncbi:unnamed protein product [Porites evermanni]|uniref:DDE Tnp4 domain-containing protein n=1 Tax=Porites evermanni TaxID=104178 RepID=A0ABN8QWW1_9CNID|nr:unnamed protein product [Porites evermanni]